MTQFKAGYGDIGAEPKEEKIFETREEAHAWLDPIVAQLPEPILIAPANEETGEPEKYECNWHSWISAISELS